MSQWMRKNRNNAGTSIILAIVIMLVVMVLALSMILAAFSVFHTVENEGSMAQCEELAYGISQAVEGQLTDTEPEETAGASELYTYLKNHLCREEWPYYRESETGHDHACADRYFSFEPDGLPDAVQEEIGQLYDDIAVRIYYEPEETEDGTATMTVDVIVARGTNKAIVTSVYRLDCDDWTFSLWKRG